MTRPQGTNGSVAPACGLPAWVVVVIDAMLSSGLLEAESVEGLKADELTELAREAVRVALADFDAEGAVAALAKRESVAT